MKKTGRPSTGADIALMIRITKKQKTWLLKQKQKTGLSFGEITRALYNKEIWK